jgi:hypothetical protein
MPKQKNRNKERKLYQIYRTDEQLSYHQALNHRGLIQMHILV